MEKHVEICTFELDILLVDRVGQQLPKPMMTITIDSKTRLIMDVSISTAKPGNSNRNTKL